MINMKRYLVLENGTVFEGEAIGAKDESTGELVFTTNMCGYIETLTDPSYFGQIVIQTFPLIGNYGFISSDVEGKSAVKGYVVRELCDAPSNFRCEKTLGEFLKENGIAGISGVDTRELTKILRDGGVMNAAISDSPDFDFKKLKSYSVKNAVKSVTCSEKEIYGKGKYRVALIDYGVKKNIVNELVKRGCEVTVFPSRVSSAEILGAGFDGVMLSNGPGDPAENGEEIKTLVEIVGKIPLFGICLGHQLLALANGGKTRKMKYGHRGANQPVKELAGTRTFITSQNHGYEVIASSVKNGVQSYVNANDGTCEGMDYPALRAFSVQFHPEAAAGPHDTAFLFDRFIRLMEEK